jgi:hypothetical protein
LLVAAEGLVLDSGLPPVDTQAEADAQPGSPELKEDYSLRRLAARPARTTPLFADVGAWLRDSFAGLDLALWAFGVGLAVLLVSFFLPLIDQVQADRLRAALQAGEARELRLEREWRAKPAVDETQQQEIRTAWASERSRLEEQLEKSTDEGLRWAYACRYGMLLGALLVAVASLGFLGAENSPARKMCGGIVLVAFALLPLLYLLLAALTGR